MTYVKPTRSNTKRSSGYFLHYHEDQQKQHSVAASTHNPLPGFLRSADARIGLRVRRSQLRFKHLSPAGCKAMEKDTPKGTHQRINQTFLRDCYRWWDSAVPILIGCGLPHIPNPGSHESYSEIFWADLYLISHFLLISNTWAHLHPWMSANISWLQSGCSAGYTCTRRIITQSCVFKTNYCLLTTTIGGVCSHLSLSFHTYKRTKMYSPPANGK